MERNVCDKVKSPQKLVAITGKARVIQKSKQEYVIMGNVTQLQCMVTIHYFYYLCNNFQWVSHVSASKVHISPYKPDIICHLLQWHNDLSSVLHFRHCCLSLSYLIFIKKNPKQPKPEPKPKTLCWMADTARSYYFLEIKGNFILKLIVPFTSELLKCVKGRGGKIIFVAS